MKSVSASFYDLDGTLIDALPFWKQANAYALREKISVAMPDEIFLWYIQENRTFLELLDRLKVQLDVYGQQAIELNRLRNEYFNTLLREKIEWMPGAPQLLEAERQSGNYKSAIITSACRSNVEAVAKRLNLKDFFRCIITREDVLGRQKPDGHGISLALKQLGIFSAPAEYRGDQITDMIAARHAGVRAVLIPNEHTHPDAHADEIYPSLHALREAKFKHNNP
jgi:HAD superfamily hydrolase (TIGR01549 family)